MAKNFNVGFGIPTPSTTENANVATPQVQNPASAQNAPVPTPQNTEKKAYTPPTDAFEAKERIKASGLNGKITFVMSSDGSSLIFTNTTKVPVLMYLRREFRMLGGEFNENKENPQWFVPIEYWRNPDKAIPSKRGEKTAPAAAEQNAQKKSDAKPTVEKVSMSYARRIAMEAARIVCPNVGDEVLRAIVDKAILNVNDKKRKTA